MAAWGFYGRSEELRQLEAILQRGRWFFVKITGRRRIGKTSLIQQALSRVPDRRALYAQIPDSGPAGVLSAFADALATFEFDERDVPRPTSLREMAQTIGALTKTGVVVVLDEFQYFNRSHLSEFTSHLQEVVDDLTRQSGSGRGGLIVLGSIFTEMTAVLEDRRAPLHSRVTDEISLGHLDIASILQILRAHADDSPARLLFLWNLFEGVPKFYRDCFEQGALASERRELLERMFFQSSSPLRSEAEHWFLNELRGRYDVVLKFVARNPGCTQAELTEQVRSVSAETKEQVGGYVRVLIERYQMLERKQPIFAQPSARRGRYYIRDNFLRSWLHALAPTVAAVHFRPLHKLIEQADERLKEAEGFGLERLAATLFEERGRLGHTGFEMTERVQGYWDRSDVEIDLVVIDEEHDRVKFGTCKRAAPRLVSGMGELDEHVARFLGHFKKYAGWEHAKLAIAPEIDDSIAEKLREAGYVPQDLRALTAGL